MSDAIVVLNAGSSSIKFSLFVLHADQLELQLRGQIEAIHTAQLDAIVFTGGIGEHSVAIRQRVCGDAAWLGVELDATGNAKGGPRVSAPISRVAAWVIPTNEELMIAQHTQALLHAT